MKRLVDVIAAVLALAALSPVMLIVAVAIWLQMGFPVLFRQERPGLYGQPFVIFKFRTMVDNEDIHGSVRPDSERLTGLGRVLRRTSLDELPELWNVLIGNMSLVGPRPLLMEYLPLYSSEQARRHEMRPGITGWAQVNGRNSISWEQKFAHDIWYIDHWTIWLDVRIVWITIIKILRAEGISQDGHVTTERFRGPAR